MRHEHTLLHQHTQLLQKQEFNLQAQLFEAQIAKAKLEKAEISADFNKERLDLQKQIMEQEAQVCPYFFVFLCSTLNLF